MARTLFLLAGLPASGKSTLLDACRDRRLALFGDELSDYRRIAPSSEMPAEYADNPSAKFSWRAFCSHIDVAPASRLVPVSERLPEEMICHVDLAWLAMLRHAAHAGAVATDAIQATFAERMSAFFPKFGRVVVNTVLCAPNELARRYNRRHGHRDDGFYQGVHPDTLANTLTAWARWCAACNAIQHVSTWDGGRINVSAISLMARLSATQSLLEN